MKNIEALKIKACAYALWERGSISREAFEELKNRIPHDQVRIILDVESRIDRELMREAKKDGHENSAAIVRKAISFFLHYASDKNTQKNDVTLSPAVYNALKKECKGAKFNRYFVDTIVRLGIAEHKKIKGSASASAVVSL